jgi:hypothetical protein
MRLYLFALALELFFDYFPEGTPLEKYPHTAELKGLLKKKGWELTTWKKRRENTWVFWNLGAQVKESDLEGMPKEQLVLFTWEPPSVQKELYDPQMRERFGKIFTWDDDLIDNKRYFKFYYPSLKTKMQNVPSFEEKKFCTMIVRRLSSSYPKQLYTERESMIRFFEDKPGEFDLYGQYWEKRKFKNWRGAVADKMDVLKNYKFCICYENTRDVNGYITEKIFDCFAAGVIPVYWGASNVADFIPTDCFIDRRLFKDNEAVYQFLKKINKEEYEKYMKNIDEFLKSEKAQLFTGTHFVETFMQIVEGQDKTPLRK